jgi:hypothetical protein
MQKAMEGTMKKHVGGRIGLFLLIAAPLVGLGIAPYHRSESRE